jgi:hypothetical protein
VLLPKKSFFVSPDLRDSCVPKERPCKRKLDNLQLVTQLVSTAFHCDWKLWNSVKLKTINFSRLRIPYFRQILSLFSIFTKKFKKHETALMPASRKSKSLQLQGICRSVVVVETGLPALSSSRFRGKRHKTCRFGYDVYKCDSPTASLMLRGHI